MRPSFIVERTTRNLDQQLGLMTVDADAALRWAEAGQGLVVGCCEPQRVLGKLAAVVRNTQPHQSVICCQSYQLADEVAELCAEQNVPVALLYRDELIAASSAAPAAIVTVPETLYRL